MENTIQHDGRTYHTAKPLPLRPFVIAVPHRRPAFIVYPDHAGPDQDAALLAVENHHDLNAVHVVASLADALRLLSWKDEHGAPARHQAIRVAALVIAELFDQGVLQEQAETEGGAPMNEQQFQAEIRRAQTMIRLAPDEADYYAGFMRGLRRAYHGESFGTEAEHQTGLALVDDSDAARAERGRGYRDGLASGGATVTRDEDTEDTEGR